MQRHQAPRATRYAAKAATPPGDRAVRRRPGVPGPVQDLLDFKRYSCHSWHSTGCRSLIQMTVRRTVAESDARSSPILAGQAVRCALSVLLVLRTDGSAVIVRRMYSVPERITLFSAGSAAVGAVYPAIMAHTGGHGIPCPLRTLTGVPCPFCGLTTATVALTHGEWATAARTSPLACLVAILAVGTAPVLLARTTGLASAPRQASSTARKRITWGAYVIVALSWLFQLHRYGFI